MLEFLVGLIGLSILMLAAWGVDRSKKKEKDWYGLADDEDLQ